MRAGAIGLMRFLSRGNHDHNRRNACLPLVGDELTMRIQVEAWKG
jgi:hypothetical protein